MISWCRLRAGNFAAEIEGPKLLLHQETDSRQPARLGTLPSVLLRGRLNEERSMSMNSPAVTSPFATDQVPVLELTESALVTVLEIRGAEPEPELLGLRVEITGSSGSEYVYDLSFDELSEAAADDLIIDGVVQVIIPAKTVDRLRGSVLDLPRNAAQGGLVIRNPNRPNPLAGVELRLEGSVAERVEQLLVGVVNPSLEAHGGFATLVGVDEENNVYITMGGGYQGCSMSRLTLTEGIQRSIKDAIEEVDQVIDATDHSAGENPFYTA